MSDAEKAKKIIQGAFGKDSHNLITPKILEYGLLSPSKAYELSSGSGLEPGTTIYGITIAEEIEKHGETRYLADYKNSGSFSSEEEARTYIKHLVAHLSMTEILKARAIQRATELFSKIENLELNKQSQYNYIAAVTTSMWDAMQDGITWERGEKWKVIINEGSKQ
jgi:hypothetical protein